MIYYLDFQASDIDLLHGVVQADHHEYKPLHAHTLCSTCVTVYASCTIAV